MCVEDIMNTFHWRPLKYICVVKIVKYLELSFHCVTRFHTNCSLWILLVAFLECCILLSWSKKLLISTDWMIAIIWFISFSCAFTISWQCLWSKKLEKSHYHLGVGCRYIVEMIKRKKKWSKEDDLTYNNLTYLLSEWVCVSETRFPRFFLLSYYRT